MIKLCKNCKYRSGVDCTHKSSLRSIDYVTGKNSYWKCNVQRNYQCGKDGRFHVPIVTLINNEPVQTEEIIEERLFQKVTSWLKQKIYWVTK
ncbi:MAG TPA: hypothetical protein VFM18_13545 [Methanosarcina sp.]|nr:hypothetical protein [Methanosarcina sp.]